MPRSTKLERLITDPLNARLTITEGKITAVETRNLVDEGDNVSVLINDAGYQNAAQVDTKIQAVVGAAPAALDTLSEIAAALAEDDSAIAALVAQDTANASAIAAIEVVNTAQNTAITAVETVNTAQDTAIAQLVTDISALENSPVLASNILFDIPYPVSNLSDVINLLLRNNAIGRSNLTGNITLDITDVACLNLINQTASVITVGLPNNPYVGLGFEIINHITSTQNIIFAGETIVPGERHAVQWDGTEWVVM